MTNDTATVIFSGRCENKGLWYYCRTSNTIMDTCENNGLSTWVMLPNPRYTFLSNSMSSEIKVEKCRIFLGICTHTIITANVSRFCLTTINQTKQVKELQFVFFACIEWHIYLAQASQRVPPDHTNVPESREVVRLTSLTYVAEC